MSDDNWCPFCRAPFVSMDPTLTLCRGLHSEPTGYRFVSGNFHVAPGAARAFEQMSGMIVALFRRHLSGDFGELDADDRAVNERAIASGEERVFSSYSVGGVRVYVITEHDRSRTTLLLADEY